MPTYVQADPATFKVFPSNGHQNIGVDNTAGGKTLGSLCTGAVIPSSFSLRPGEQVYPKGVVLSLVKGATLDVRVTFDGSTAPIFGATPIGVLLATEPDFNFFPEPNAIAQNLIKLIASGAGPQQVSVTFIL